MQMNLNDENSIDAFRDNLKSAYNKNSDKMCFGFSGGDDSTLLIDEAVNMFGRDICVIFEDTHIEYKETYKFIKKMVDYWGLTNFNITQPLENFVDVATRMGLHGIAKKKTPCCSALKNAPLSKWMHANNKKITAGGIRRSEGCRSAGYSMQRYSDYYKIFYYSPMLYVRDDDVKKWFCDTGCPKNPLYNAPYNVWRTGCAVCPQPLKRHAFNNEYKDYYQFLHDKFPRWYNFAKKAQMRWIQKHKIKPGDRILYKIYDHRWKPSLESALEAGGMRQRAFTDSPNKELKLHGSYVVSEVKQ